VIRYRRALSSTDSSRRTRTGDESGGRLRDSPQSAIVHRHGQGETHAADTAATTTAPLRFVATAVCDVHGTRQRLPGLQRLRSLFVATALCDVLRFPSSPSALTLPSFPRIFTPMNADEEDREKSPASVFAALRRDTRDGPGLLKRRTNCDPG
jgi:hypothetical protein